MKIYAIPFEDYVNVVFNTFDPEERKLRCKKVFLEGCRKAPIVAGTAS